MKDAPTEPPKKEGPARFKEEDRKRGCDFLPTAMVAKVLNVAEAALTQRKLMGCIYTGELGEEEVQARMGTLRVMKTTEEASRWFGNATKGMSDEETKEAMAQIKAQMKKKGDLDTKSREKTADKIGDGLVGLTGGEGIRFETVEGIGDEARIQLSDGTLWIRVSNLSFTLAAYKGPKMKMELPKGAGLKEMASASIEASRKWHEDTFEERKKFALALAKSVVEGLN